MRSGGATGLRSPSVNNTKLNNIYHPQNRRRRTRTGRLTLQAATSRECSLSDTTRFLNDRMSVMMFISSQVCFIYNTLIIICHTGAS